MQQEREVAQQQVAEVEATLHTVETKTSKQKSELAEKEAELAQASTTIDAGLKDIKVQRSPLSIKHCPPSNQAAAQRVRILHQSTALVLAGQVILRSRSAIGIPASCWLGNMCVIY